jgi:hypothetical protein
MNKDTAVKYIDWAIKGCLFLLALSAPLSIAATQTAWALALFFWLIRLVFERPRFEKAALEIALLAFLGLTIISSVFSYEPEISIRKLVPVSLVTIVYLVASQARAATFRRRAVAILLAGAAVSVIGTLTFLAIGQNLKVIALTPNSPLRAAGVIEGDTILRIGGERIDTPNDLRRVASRHQTPTDVELTIYRQELVMTSTLRVDGYEAGSGDLGFGITEWARGRDARASGFFGHYVTYAEVLQLVMSVAFGLLVVAPGGLFSRSRVLLMLAFTGYCVGMFLTITRASWAGFIISAGIITLLSASRKVILTCVALAIPIGIAGFLYMQQKRNVTFVDPKDGSTTWRLMVWREAVEVLTSNPRHLLVGVGMDSIKKRWPEWRMFDNGKQPIGHLHSDYLQIAFERGTPALIAWLAWLAIYLAMLSRRLRLGGLEWPERGLLLGALGGTIGFLASGLVHYNLGDSEVAMVFYLIMGLSLGAMRTGDGTADAPNKLHAAA